jgi:hypothetical protein
MNLKNLALLTTSVVALGISAAPSHAAPTMGVIYLGFAEWWDNYDFDGLGQYDYNHPSLYGFGRVNIPYDGTKANLQLDFFGDGSLHDAASQSLGSRGNFGAGAHINWRDSSEGLLGIFAATGRVWDIYGGNNSPAMMAGLEGQYYCGPWTLYGQAGYMDSSGGYFMQNAGFVRGLVSYYAGPKLKVTGGVGYIDGELYGANATAWTWQADAEYWFGKSVPVAFTLKYEGRDAQVEFSSSFKSELNSNAVSVGLSFYFGGGSIEEADKNGAGTEIPNFDWFRLAVP